MAGQISSPNRSVLAQELVNIYHNNLAIFILTREMYCKKSEHVFTQISTT